MFWAGDVSKLGVCMGDGSHSAVPQSYKFFLPHDHNAPGQDEWRLCVRCRVMVYGGDPANKGVCPTGGGHDRGSSLNHHLDFTP